MTTRMGRISEFAAEPLAGREVHNLLDAPALPRYEDGVLLPGLAAPGLLSLETAIVADGNLRAVAETQAMLAMSRARVPTEVARRQTQTGHDPSGSAQAEARPADASHRQREDRP